MFNIVNNNPLTSLLCPPLCPNNNSDNLTLLYYYTLHKLTVSQVWYPMHMGGPVYH